VENSKSRVAALRSGLSANCNAATRHRPHVFNSGGCAALHPRKWIYIPCVCHVVARPGSRQVSFVERNAVLPEQSPIFIEQRFLAVMFDLTVDVFDERVFSGERCRERAVSVLPTSKTGGILPVP
jgi:hypothetical protein